MAGFELVKNMNDIQFEVVRVASQAYAIGDAVMRDRTSDATEVVIATASSTSRNIYGVAMEAVTSSATRLLIARIEPSQVWRCEVTNAVNVNHNGQRMILTDANTVNNTGTDGTTEAGIVEQVGAAGAKGLFRFLQAATSA